jgi:hypothetical protein
MRDLHLVAPIACCTVIPHVASRWKLDSSPRVP